MTQDDNLVHLEIEPNKQINMILGCFIYKKGTFNTELKVTF